MRHDGKMSQTASERSKIKKKMETVKTDRCRKRMKKKIRICHGNKRTIWRERDRTRERESESATANLYVQQINSHHKCKKQMKSNVINTVCGRIVERERADEGKSYHSFSVSISRDCKYINASLSFSNIYRRYKFYIDREATSTSLSKYIHAKCKHLPPR